jgi:DNA polymerase-3 subunit epsilon
MNSEVKMSEAAIEDAIRLLESHGDYRLLRRIKAKEQFNPHGGGQTRIGVIVDTETTGLYSETDAVIELGIVKFEYDAISGEVFRVLETLNELEDPGMPIPPESTAVHGITDAMVAGTRINDERVQALLQGVNVAIAHNAGFDRVFLEKRLPVFASLPWACSLAQINWKAEGFGSAKLSHIGMDFGLFFDAHRAVTDCVALLEILQKRLPTCGVLAFKALLDEARQQSYRVNADGAPFEAKDMLKGRAYRWDAGRKCWHRTVTGLTAKDDELGWLKASVYQGRRARVTLEQHDSLTRFSGRPGHMSVQDI